MFGPIVTIARNTFTEAIRQPIFIVLLFGVIFLLMLGTAWAAYTLDDDNKLLLDTGLSMVLASSGVMAAFLASGVLAREIDNKTVLTVISKPIGRPAFVIGKFLGVAGATAIAWLIWSLVFLLTVRHKVLSGAGDELDGPVWAFGLAALAIALIVAVWGNYFYNWVFNSTFVSVLTVTLPIAYLLVLIINKDWQFQPIYTEFNPDLAPVTNYGEDAKSLWQVIVALLMALEAALILVAVAVAVALAEERIGEKPQQLHESERDAVAKFDRLVPGRQGGHDLCSCSMVAGSGRRSSGHERPRYRVDICGDQWAIKSIVNVYSWF